MFNESIIPDKEYNKNLKANLAQSLKDELYIFEDEFKDYKLEIENPKKLDKGFDAKLNIYNKKNELVGYIAYYETHYLNICAYTADNDMVAHEIGNWGDQRNIAKLIRILINPDVTKAIVTYEANINSLKETIDLEKKPEDTLSQTNIVVEKIPTHDEEDTKLKEYCDKLSLTDDERKKVIDYLNNRFPNESKNGNKFENNCITCKKNIDDAIKSLSLSAFALQRIESYKDAEKGKQYIVLFIKNALLKDDYNDQHPAYKLNTKAEDRTNPELDNAATIDRLHALIFKNRENAQNYLDNHEEFKNEGFKVAKVDIGGYELWSCQDLIDYEDLKENIYLGRQDGLVLKEIPNSVRPEFLKKNGKCSNIVYANKKDYQNTSDKNNIDYEKGWILKRNPEPEKLHNKFAKDEKKGVWYGIAPGDIGE
jgi:hypothetical protein